MWLLCSFQGPPRGAPEGIPRRRSLKTQQHARARAPRDVAPREGVMGTRIDEFRLARPGSVDVLGPVVGGHRIDSTCGHPRAMADGRRCRRATGVPLKGLPRKEVIQPQLPLRLPCYDFTPVTSPTFDGSLPCGLGHRLRVLLTPVV
jgi:hypothetical protein